MKIRKKRNSGDREDGIVYSGREGKGFIPRRTALSLGVAVTVPSAFNTGEKEDSLKL